MPENPDLDDPLWEKPGGCNNVTRASRLRTTGGTVRPRSPSPPVAHSPASRDRRDCGENRPDILGLTESRLRSALEGPGQPGYRARQILDWIYRRRVFDFSMMSDLPAGLREYLAARFAIGLPACTRFLDAADTTRKFLFRFPDGESVETVLIPASPALYGDPSDRLTACVSTQVGCALGCRFCASGLAGLRRNLTAGEIVAQVLAAVAPSGQRAGNIVFMGMGEPFANYRELLQAIEILNAPWGAGIGARQMTVSTSGLAPRIRDFADQPLQVRLAVSLHGATDAVRGRIMPVNARYPLADLLDACAYYVSRKRQRLTFEFILIGGLNDTREQARALAGIAAPLRAKVNLIPCNPVAGLEWEPPAPETVRRFVETLRRAGTPTTLRREKGSEIAAACGQLRLAASRA